jgi:hypothetical protein
MQSEVLRLSTQLLHALSSNINNLKPSSLLASLRGTEQDGEQIERKHIIQLLQIALKSVGNHVLSEPFCYALLALVLRKFILSDIPAAVLQRGLQRTVRTALTIVQDVHSPLRIRIDWSDRRMVSSIIYGFLKRIDYALDDMDHAIDIVLKTFLTASRSAMENAMHIGNSPPELRLQYHTIAGPATTSTAFYADTLLMDIPVSLDVQSDLTAGSASRKPAGLIVALFSCSLEIHTPALGQTLQLTTSMHDDRTHEELSAEYLLLQSFAQQVQHSHVDLVVCQKRVHPYLQRQLRARGVLVLPRVSVRYMAALQALTGARVHTSLPSLGSIEHTSLDPKSMGYLHSISFSYKFGKSFVVAEGFQEGGDEFDAGDRIQGEALQDHLLAAFGFLDTAFLLPYVKGVVPRHQTFSSVLLTAPSETVLVKWKDAFEACIAHLSSLIPGPAYALPGTGMWQTYVAQQLRLQCQRASNSTATRMERLFAEVQCMFAECLESSAHVQSGVKADVSMKFGHDRIALRLQSMDSAQEATRDGLQTGDCYTFNNRTRGSLNVHAKWRATRTDEEAPIREYYLPPGEGMVALDGLQGSLLALQVATDTACALLSVDGVIVMEPETVER